jgi:mRNA interferase RelE/StbE
MHGKPLHGLKGEFWRFRVGDIRIIAKLEYDRVEVLIVTIGHRREVYR